MNAIEYTAPNRPSVWACGVCWRVCAGAVSCGEYAWTQDLAEFSREQAERCCICTCGKPAGRKHSFLGMCKDCEEQWHQQHAKQSSDTQRKPPCPSCNGDGVIEADCPNCGGSGEL